MLSTDKTSRAQAGDETDDDGEWNMSTNPYVGMPSNSVEEHHFS